MVPTSPAQTVSPDGCWRSLIDQGPFLIATFSIDGRLLSLNRTPSGAPGDQLIGRSIAELFPLGDGPDTEAALRTVIETGRATRVEIPARLSESRMMWVELELLPIHESGAVTGAIGLAVDVTESKQTALELRMTVNALHRTIEAREQLASDLHDGTLQSLYGIGLRLEALRAALNTGRRDGESHLDRALEETRSAMGEIRRYLAEGIGPAQLPARWDELLSGLLRGLEVDGGPRLVIDLDQGAIETIPERWRGEVAFIAREAVSNALRHANAKRVVVRLVTAGVERRLEIQDDGKGFDEQADRRGFGLLTMTRRAAQVGGVLTIQTAPGTGTLVQLVLPADLERARA